MEIKLEEEIAAKPETVFDLISKGQLFLSTGVIPGKLKMDFREGGKFSFEWISGGFCDGDFLSVERPRRVSFQWSSHGCPHPAENMTTVDISLEPTKGGTLVSLIHSGFQSKESCADHERGWSTSLEDFASGVAFFDKLKDYSWNTFDVILNIRSTPEKLFGRWATTSGMESFFIEKMDVKNATGTIRQPNEEFQPGDRFDWRWIHGHQSYGRILEVEKNKRVSFTFGESEVSVRVFPHELGTWLQIQQTQIPEHREAQIGVHVNCRTGWTYFATVLKALEEHGVDIRDKNPKTAGSLRVGFAIP